MGCCIRAGPARLRLRLKKIRSVLYGYVDRNKCWPTRTPRGGGAGRRCRTIVATARSTSLTAVPPAENLVEKLTQPYWYRRNKSGENHEKLVVFTVDGGSKGAERAPTAAAEG